MDVTLRKLRLINYGCFKDFEIDFSDFTTLVGMNGIGKTTILNAINDFQNGKIEKKSINLNSKKNDAKLHFTFSLCNDQIIPLSNGDKVYYSRGNEESPLSIRPEKENEIVLELHEQNLQIINSNNIKIDKHLLNIYSRAPPSNVLDTTLITHDLETSFSIFNNYNHDNQGREVHTYELYDYINIGKNFSKNQEMICYTRLKPEDISLDAFIEIIKFSIQKFLKNKVKIVYMDNIIANALIEDNIDQKIVKIANNPISFVFSGIDWQRQEDIIYNQCKSIEKEFNKWFKEQNPPLNSIEFEFSSINRNIQIFRRLENGIVQKLSRDSAGFQWIFRFIMIFYKELVEGNENQILLIDEPGLNLHPKAQKQILKFIKAFSKKHQIIYATHMPDLLDYGNPNSIRLIVRNNNGIFVKKPPINNKIFVMDCLRDLTPPEIAALMMENNYAMLDLDTINELQKTDIFKKLRDFVQLPENNFKLRQIGTKKEDPQFQLINNMYFLSILPSTIQLKETREQHFEFKKIIVAQIHINSELIEDTVIRFKTLCKNWGNNVDSNNLLCYSSEKVNQINQKIAKITACIREQTKASECRKTLVVFPENTVTFSSLINLIDLSFSLELVMIIGMEHIKYSNLVKFNDELKHQYAAEFNRDLNIIMPELSGLKDDSFVNAAAIIDFGTKLTYQFKNNPVYIKEDLIENIPLQKNPNISVINTNLGRLAVFICKDFMVYRNILPTWMRIHNVKFAIIPSFTPIVWPFLHNLKEISRHSDNSNLMFVLANLAEYGGSDVVSFACRNNFEPTNANDCYKREEGLFVYTLNKDSGEKPLINFIKIQDCQESLD